MNKITKPQLKKAKPENVKRLARWLRFRDIESMSHRQLIKLLVWYFNRPEKKARDMTWVQQCPQRGPFNV